MAGKSVDVSTEYAGNVERSHGIEYRDVSRRRIDASCFWALYNYAADRPSAEVLPSFLSRNAKDVCLMIRAKAAVSSASSLPLTSAESLLLSACEDSHKTPLPAFEMRTILKVLQSGSTNAEDLMESVKLDIIDPCSNVSFFEAKLPETGEENSAWKSPPQQSHCYALSTFQSELPYWIQTTSFGLKSRSDLDCKEDGLVVVKKKRQSLEPSLIRAFSVTLLHKE